MVTLHAPLLSTLPPGTTTICLAYPSAGSIASPMTVSRDNTVAADHLGRYLVDTPHAWFRRPSKMDALMYAAALGFRTFAFASPLLLFATPPDALRDPAANGRWLARCAEADIASVPIASPSDVLRFATDASIDVLLSVAAEVGVGLAVEESPFFLAVTWR